MIPERSGPFGWEGIAWRKAGVALLVFLLAASLATASATEEAVVPSPSPSPASPSTTPTFAPEARAGVGGVDPDDAAPEGDGLGIASFGELSFTSGNDPLTIEADQLEFDYDNNRLVYRGSVRVHQGDFQLESRTLTILFVRGEGAENAQLERVVAVGAVQIQQGERRASGRRAVFDQKTRQLILRGNPVLRDGRNEVQGERMTVFLDEGRSVVESGEKKRVSAVFYPGDERNATPAPRTSATPTEAGAPR